MSSPVIFLVFNRPECTRRVFEQIRAARPPRLFVICDGPRADVPSDAGRVEAVRRIIKEGVDWPCVVQHDYAATNMGCRLRVSTGLTAAFASFEEAIVLEDDTLPDPSFFRYCTELLARFRDDERIMHIGANNFVGGSHRFTTSYVFSRYGHIWGWATWRRAWEKYDPAMAAWADPLVRDRIARDCRLADERGYWYSIFHRSAAEPSAQSTWDYQWTFACWLHGGLATYPAVNLIENIGFGDDATHTAHLSSTSMPAATPMPFPLVHPSRRVSSARFDGRAFHSIFMPETPMKSRLQRWLRQALPNV